MISLNALEMIRGTVEKMRRKKKRERLKIRINKDLCYRAEMIRRVAK